MKKLFALLLAAAFTFSLAAVAQEAAPADKKDAPKATEKKKGKAKAKAKAKGKDKKDKEAKPPAEPK